MLNKHSSQNVKSAVEPLAMRSDEAVRVAFTDMQLVTHSWPAVLDLHSAMLIVAEFDRMRTASRATLCDAASAKHDVVQPDCTVDASGFRWLTSLKEAILSLHAYWRREREVRKAVAALSEFDDRTLRDMGIVSRTDIEHTVRCCQDG
ncbi:DUF1127 domain-containing protein [Bradyrhizobium sp. BRP22]|uniref:DUF1127 domain-containing protein n=1 Tax=Bradyrhizobium sp. BRP22 TaxID=2793821 RepID=UPI001CD59F80|nr:DUF1127 domain-containing protein [Bradyrhizobium sp. BRP22]MCA1452678.1 DUF1127 domain-containing protein [Bradyrhizobium sp. BRP22]